MKQTIHFSSPATMELGIQHPSKLMSKKGYEFESRKGMKRKSIRRKAVDSNNNASGINNNGMDKTDGNGICQNEENDSLPKHLEKYSFRPRSIQNRIETEKRRKGNYKKEPKPKPKPPPLSKYRRKTANARERGRMKEINQAFESLQKVVPQKAFLHSMAGNKSCEKLTKITTLRLAMNYIEALKELLNGCGSTVSSGSSGILSGTEFSQENISYLPMNRSLPSNSSSTLVQSNFNLPSNSSCASNSVTSTSAHTTHPIKLLDRSLGLQPRPTISSYTVVSTPGPDCIQTVMRSVVTPANAAALAAAAAAANASNHSSTNSSAAVNNINHNLSSVLNNTVTNNSHCQIQMHHFPLTNVPSPSAMSSCSSASSSSCSSSPSHGRSLQLAQKLPPISSTFMKKSFMLDSSRLAGVGRTGSLSSLGTESDLGSDCGGPCSDLLSDEGSSTCLDEPMFQDFIGISTPGPHDLDMLLDSPPDSQPLPFDIAFCGS